MVYALWHRILRVLGSGLRVVGFRGLGSRLYYRVECRGVYDTGSNRVYIDKGIEFNS